MPLPLGWDYCATGARSKAQNLRGWNPEDGWLLKICTFTLSLAPSSSPFILKCSLFSGFEFIEPDHGYEGRVGGKLAEPFLCPKKGSNPMCHTIVRLTSPNFRALVLSTKGSSKLLPGHLVLSYLPKKPEGPCTTVICSPLIDVLHWRNKSQSLSIEQMLQ